MNTENWYQIENLESVATPALLVYPDRIGHNIKRMIEIAGDVARLRPHVKTYKTAEIIQMQQAYGIQKFKCATIAEAELLAQCKAQDVVLAMQLVGHNIQRYCDLIKTYKETKFSTLTDDLEHANHLTDIFIHQDMKLSLWMDINVGMDRSGIQPGESAEELYKYMVDHDAVEVLGFHVYDGHLRNPNFEERKKQCDADFSAVTRLEERLNTQGYKVDTIIAGGSPSFPIHAMRKGVELSPGTVLLWDAGYEKKFPEIGMLAAAVLISRVISKPTKGVVTSDLGHKSLASEMPFPRIQLLNAGDLEQISQSEEHFVFNTPNWDSYKIGDLIYAVPVHICPTVAKYQYLQVIESQQVIGRWKVRAAVQKISI